MTASKTRPPASKPPPATVPGSTSETDPAAQQMTVAVESAGVMMRGLEAMRKINDRAVQDALLRYTDAARKLSASHQPMELFAIPSAMMRSEFECATSYWQELSGAAMEMQAELLGCSTHLIDSDALLQAASVVKAVPDLKSFTGFNGFNGFFGPHRSAAA